MAIDMSSLTWPKDVEKQDVSVWEAMKTTRDPKERQMVQGILIKAGAPAQPVLKMTVTEKVDLLIAIQEKDNGGSEKQSAAKTAGKPATGGTVAKAGPVKKTSAAAPAKKGGALGGLLGARKVKQEAVEETVEETTEENQSTSGSGGPSNEALAESLAGLHEAVGELRATVDELKELVSGVAQLSAEGHFILRHLMNAALSNEVVSADELDLDELGTPIWNGEEGNGE